MLRDKRIIYFALFCLVFLNVGCREATPSTVPVRSTNTQITRSVVTTVFVQPTTTPTVIWPTITNRGLLYDEPCSPPCWEGITPGISSEEDVICVLEQLKVEGMIKRYTKGYTKAPSDFYYLVTLPPGHVVDVMFDDEHVECLVFSYPLVDYRVKQVIERFGEPEAYFSGFPESDCSCEEWDDSHADAPSVPGYLFYPSQGVTFVVQKVRGYKGCICPEMMVAIFYYYQPVSLVDALNKDRSPACALMNLNNDEIIEWHGYGSGY